MAASFIGLILLGVVVAAAIFAAVMVMAGRGKGGEE